MPKAMPIRQRDRLKPAVGVTRIHFHGDCHLPDLDIQIIRSVKRAARTGYVPIFDNLVSTEMRRAEILCSCRHAARSFSIESPCSAFTSLPYSLLGRFTI